MFQTDTCGPFQATPHETLMLELLDCRVPKSEREHAAAREIVTLRAERDEMTRIAGKAVGEIIDLQAKIDALRALVAELTIERDRLNREVQNAYNNGYSSGFDAGKEGE